jgi:hypothetical protein
MTGSEFFRSLSTTRGETVRPVGTYSARVQSPMEERRCSHGPLRCALANHLIIDEIRVIRIRARLRILADDPVPGGQGGQTCKTFESEALGIVDNIVDRFPE